MRNNNSIIIKFFKKTINDKILKFENKFEKMYKNKERKINYPHQKTVVTTTIVRTQNFNNSGLLRINPSIINSKSSHNLNGYGLINVINYQTSNNINHIYNSHNNSNNFHNNNGYNKNINRNNNLRPKNNMGIFFLNNI